MPEAFLTTRRGSIDSITLNRYDYLEWIIADSTKKDKLKYWLEKKSGFLLYDVEDTCFFTFTKLADESTNQYRIGSAKTISAPFGNTQLISNLIATLLRSELSKHYNQFLNQNIFSVKTVDLYPFTLIKGVEFNVEVFHTGQYLIHVLPVSKIVSSKSPVDKDYINFLKTNNKNNSNTDEMEFSLVNTVKFYRQKINLLDKELFKRLDEILSVNPNFFATFDYHFLANYSPDLFGKVTEDTSKNLKNAILFANPVLDNFVLPDFLKLSQEKYYKTDILELEMKNNLLVGGASENITLYSKSNTSYGIRLDYTRNDISDRDKCEGFLNDKAIIEFLNHTKFPLNVRANITDSQGFPKLNKIYIDSGTEQLCVNKQAASYYSGIYQPVSNCNVLPIVIGDLRIDIFKELMQAFNRGSNNFKILPVVFIGQNEEIDRVQIQELTGIEENKTVVAIFCKYQMPSAFFEPIKGFKYQIYQGDTSDNKQNRAKISNFVCKLLEKSGGIISAIADTYMGKDGYFIGIDLGHTTLGEEKFSNMATVLFDNRGIIIGQDIRRKIPRKENLIESSCIIAFRNLSAILVRNNLPRPKHLVIHRDGKLHLDDISSLTTSLEKVWGKVKVDVVEIIKSGFPIIAIKDEKGSVINPVSGSSYQDNKHKYSILVTNTQADDHSVVINPIIIKHKFGDMEFSKIVEQVYWFTKIYTNNLYNSTRLPATTLKANNIVGTSGKLRKPTYLG